MARNGSGTYSNPYPNFVSGTVISSSEVDANNSDIATALTQSIAVDGQAVVTANIPLATHKLTGVSAGSAATDSLSLGQAQAEAFIWCGTAGGSADAITLAPSPAITAYAAGQRFVWMASSSVNTGATTVAISGLSAIALQDNGAALVAGNHAASKMFMGILNTTSTVQIMQVQISGTDPLIVSSLTVDGNSQFNGTVTVGIDGTGKDVKFFGDTASAYLLWDESADKLLTAGGALIDIVKDKLMIGGVAVTTTAAELNILDGVTSTTAELNILDGVTSTTAELNILDGVTSTAAELNILDGVTSTTAELNLIDGGTARGTTAVASGDGILINDAGTMAMTNVDTVSTYFSSHSVGGGNIVTVGALNAGSITSGFTSIDVGAGAITTTGVVTAGSLDISGNADIDGTLEADAITINGTAIGSIYGVIAGSSSIVTTGALNSGSITSGFTSIDVGAGAITTTGVITGGTVETTTDTSAGDNAAIGYTSAEGLILTGQGSTNDVTIKNDADAEVMGVLTGTTTAAFTGEVTGTGFTGTLDGILGGGTPAAATVTTIDASGVATATTFEPDGDTSAADNAAIGYTSVEGLILTGQGSSGDVTIKNDADTKVMEVLTGTTTAAFSGEVTGTGFTGTLDGVLGGGTPAAATVTTIDASGVATATTFEPDGDTSAADNAAIGYTSAEGLILTGQGSTNDVTIKNDADATVFSIATGTTTGTFAGTVLAKTDTDTSNTGGVTLDFTANQNFILTFTGNVTLANPTTEQLGQSGIIICIQDATGSRTLSLGTDYETAGAAGITLSTAGTSVDIIPYFVQSASNILLGAVQKAFA